MVGAAYLQILRPQAIHRPAISILVARVPDSIAALAIILLVRDSAGSYSLAGLAGGAYGIGTAVSAPAAGRALDRFGQRCVLPLLAAAFALTLGVLALVAGVLPPAWTIGLSLVAGLTRPPHEAALRALWPRLVNHDRLATAYALDSTLQELIWIGAPLLLTLLLVLGSPALPLLACAIVCVLGTATYVRSTPVPRRSQATVDVLGPLRSRRLRHLLGPSALYGTAAGALTVGFAGFASGHGSSAHAGVFVALWGIGSLAGGVAYGSRRWTRPVEEQATLALICFGLGVAVLAAAPNEIALAILVVLPGIPLSPWLGTLSASVQRSVPPTMLAEAFTWIFAVITAGMAAGNALGGAIIEASGPGVAFLGAAGFALGGAALDAKKLTAAPPYFRA